MGKRERSAEDITNHFTVPFELAGSTPDTVTWSRETDRPGVVLTVRMRGIVPEQGSPVVKVDGVEIHDETGAHAVIKQGALSTRKPWRLGNDGKIFMYVDDVRGFDFTSALEDWWNAVSFGLNVMFDDLDAELRSARDRIQAERDDADEAKTHFLAPWVVTPSVSPSMSKLGVSRARIDVVVRAQSPDDDAEAVRALIVRALGGKARAVCHSNNGGGRYTFEYLVVS